MAKARADLEAGTFLLEGGYFEQAGRMAYMVAFHSALALIVMETGKEPRTHNGTHTEFARVVRGRPEIAHELVAFLSSTYEMKSEADYAPVQGITADEAKAALAFAEQFVTVIAALLQAPP